MTQSCLSMSMIMDNNEPFNWKDSTSEGGWGITEDARIRACGFENNHLPILALLSTEAESPLS